MEHLQTLVFFIITLGFILNVFAASIGEENASVTEKSAEVIPIDLVGCTSSPEANYQCVRIEDCRARRRRGSRKFCKWEGKPTHVCCLEKSTKTSSTRKKRYNSYFNRDSGPSRKFSNHYQGWIHEDKEDSEKSWDHPRHHDDRFFHHRNHRHQFHDYGRDFEASDYAGHEYPIGDAEPECGVLAEEKRGSIRTVTDAKGELPSKASSPWMVAIGQTRINGGPTWFCGGVLLSKIIVLTAAHCIVQGSPNVVRIGKQDTRSNANIGKYQDSEIESSVIHPNHKQPRVYHDIAIVRLKNPVRYSEYVRPICLPPDDGNLYENSRVILTGWSNDYDVGEKIREVEIGVINNFDCNAKYGFPSITENHNITLPRGIISSQLCARDEKGGEDACDGDSGGPMVTKKGKKHIVIGIVSSGLGCSSESHPGIYTRVSSYTNWINKYL